MIRALAVTVSNRAAAGVYEDRSGPVLAELLRAAGCEVDGPVVIPDGAPVEVALQDAVSAGYDVVVTHRRHGPDARRPDPGDDQAGAGPGDPRHRRRPSGRPASRPACRRRRCHAALPGWPTAR